MFWYREVFREIAVQLSPNALVVKASHNWAMLGCLILDHVSTGLSAESKGTKMFVWRLAMCLGVCRSFTQAMLSGMRYLCSTSKGASPA